MSWRESRFMQVVWTVIRVYIGWEWLSAGISKTFGASAAAWVGPNAGAAVTGFLQGALTKTGGQHPDVSWWYASFIQNIALPNAKVFGYVIAWGELLVGLGLILGCFTTIALLAAVFLNMSYLLAGAVSTNPMLLFWEALLLWAGAAAYYWGVDRILIPQWKKRRLKQGIA
ncbi:MULTISPECIES: DoxX family membrane protein [Dehalobacter]|uniref:DoxX family membrane protein n=2 Tax=Dehalobacter restrictus TaxID=55583 RepID=A0A857DH91_9FIRM|nr:MULTISPECIES: DoxX family membrane protein [Dehalobacter]AHF10071.1 Crp/Fnr family transcriptional regulator [Dehalobacter restrictus DSM 9455]MCG1025285.1 DoxX family membrane protein [Dehalobacter sp.]MDJ0306186.1 DoxX family membrane protein [Dehalobacter sp.]OCZ51976.1 Crp/Fnr family transcriptional regulator [Dehalobacter sp. TeCB1]QHA00674.1 DoxX family membrane protein [Dehalobacter restrictus]